MPRWLARPLALFVMDRDRARARLLPRDHDWYDARCGGWTRLALFAVLSVALLRAACLVNTSGDTGPLALYGEANQDQPGGGGMLVRDGGCLYVESQGRRIFVAFPQWGTTWDKTRQAVRRNGDLLRVGTWIEPGGSQSSGTGREIDWRVSPDPTCDLTTIWWAN